MKHRVALVILPAAALVACGTDNGPNVFGPTVDDPFPAKDASGGSSSGGGGDAGGDDDGGAKDAGADAPAACTSGTIAVLAGDDAALSGAVKIGDGAWAGAAIPGGAAMSRPALVAFGQGFLGVTRGSGAELQSTAYKTSWSVPAPFGVANVKGPPALAVAGAAAHVVYSAGPGANTDFWSGVHDGNAWNLATTAVGDSFGTVGAGLGGAGTTAVFVENGLDKKLYTRTFDGAWSGSSAIAGAATEGDLVETPPVVVSGSSPIDLVAVYVKMKTRQLSYATRDATSKTWTDRGVLHDLATTAEPFSAARVGQSTFVVTFRGQDANGYYAQGTMTASGAIAWAAAQPVGGAGNVAVDSAPSVAKGVCGDDAIVVYAASGAVKGTRLRGTSWTAPEAVTGASGARVAVATK